MPAPDLPWSSVSFVAACSASCCACGRPCLARWAGYKANSGPHFGIVKDLRCVAGRERSHLTGSKKMSSARVTIVAPAGAGMFWRKCDRSPSRRCPLKRWSSTSSRERALGTCMLYCHLKHLKRHKWRPWKAAPRISCGVCLTLCVGTSTATSMKGRSRAHRRIPKSPCGRRCKCWSSSEAKSCVKRSKVFCNTVIGSMVLQIFSEHASKILLHQEHPQRHRHQNLQEGLDKTHGCSPCAPSSGQL